MLPWAACTASTSIRTIRQDKCLPCSETTKTVVDFRNSCRHLQRRVQLRWNAAGINPCHHGVFPDLAIRQLRHDWVGRSCGQHPRRRRPITCSRCRSDNPTVSWVFHCRRHQLEVNTLTGASWYVLNTAANALPTRMGAGWFPKSPPQEHFWPNQRQIFPLGVGADQVQTSIEFDGTGHVFRRWR